jgi:hypothetical protein
MSTRASSVFAHSAFCGGGWEVSILARSDSVANMRFKEAILIKDKKPQINKKEELSKLSVLV